MTDSQTIFTQAGGAVTFESLVGRFYELVAGDPLLRPMYPEDLEPPRRHLTLFLIQYFGGPPAYSEQRGHPRLRMRHLPFAIDEAVRDRWVAYMLASLDSLDISEPVRDEMRRYFEDAATFLIKH
ncbi:MAG TPA: globin [Dehalococcoidia bacterium]|nr:globin [Dehalococcoidia bacterium]